MLEEVVKAVEGRCDVFMDGGVRHGTDILKALALGAKAVFIGRPVLWGLACQVKPITYLPSHYPQSGGGLEALFRPGINICPERV